MDGRGKWNGDVLTNKKMVRVITTRWKKPLNTLSGTDEKVGTTYSYGSSRIRR